MPTFSPQEGLSGLESGDALAPQRENALAVPQTGKTARLAAKIAKKVGPLLTAAGLAAASTGCDNGNNGLINSAFAQSSPTTAATAPTAPTAPIAAPTTTGAAPAPTTNPFDSNKLVCANMGLTDYNGTRAAQNYRRMFVQTVVSGTPQLFEPCATSAEPNEMGRFIQADCNNDGQYRNCVVKDSYVDNSYNVVNTETRVKWLLNGHNNVESAQSVGYIFPMGLAARTGIVITTLDPTSPVVYGQRIIPSRQQPVTSVTPSIVKKIQTPTPSNDTSKNLEQDKRLDNLEAQVAQNSGRLNDHSQVLELIIRSNNQPTHTPHPTHADYDSQGRKAATRANR